MMKRWKRCKQTRGLIKAQLAAGAAVSAASFYFFLLRRMDVPPFFKGPASALHHTSNFQVSSCLLSPPLADLKSISGGWRGQKMVKISLIAAAVGCTFWSSPRRKIKKETDLQLQGHTQLGLQHAPLEPPPIPRSGAFHNSVAARRERRSPRQVNNQPTQSAVCDRFHANKAFSYSLRRGSTRRGLSRCSLLITINL